MEENKKLLVNVFVLGMEKTFYFITDDSSLEVEDPGRLIPGFLSPTIK